MSQEIEYHSRDFDWEDLRIETEIDQNLNYHLLPFLPSTKYLSPETSLPFQDLHAWNNFHIRHSTGKFFKERRYLLKEFPEVVSDGRISKFLEVGCGNGSTALPILCANEKNIVYACDCSVEDLERAKEAICYKISSAEERFHPFCVDIVSSPFPEWLACHSCRGMSMQRDTEECSEKGLNGDDDCCIGGVDFISLIFTLSAIPLEMMPKAIKECFSVLKPNGLLFFRDYGLYDMSMLRFKPQKRVGFREYARCDGTRSYFFSLDTVKDLFISAGFIVVEAEYCCVRSLNRRIGKSMRRVWVHAKFQKPLST